MTTNNPPLPTENYRLALPNLDQYPPKQQVLILLKAAAEIMENMKTVGRTAQDRHIAIAVTDTEKIAAWWAAVIAKQLI